MAKYQNPGLQRSLWQVANTLVPRTLLLYPMYVSFAYSYWLTLALALPAGGLLTRTFIIFHDCGHGSFFKSQRANEHPRNDLRPAGLHALLSVALRDMPSTTPPRATSIAAAPATSTTLTVQRVSELSRWGRFKYRLYRSPIVMLGLGPWFTF